MLPCRSVSCMRHSTSQPSAIPKRSNDCQVTNFNQLSRNLLIVIFYTEQTEEFVKPVGMSLYGHVSLKVALSGQ